MVSTEHYPQPSDEINNPEMTKKNKVDDISPLHRLYSPHLCWLLAYCPLVLIQYPGECETEFVASILLQRMVETENAKKRREKLDGTRLDHGQEEERRGHTLWQKKTGPITCQARDRLVGDFMPQVSTERVRA